MNLPFKDQLQKIYSKPQVKKPQNHKSEQLSEREWKDIMGTNMRVHTRVGGRVRQK